MTSLLETEGRSLGHGRGRELTPEELRWGDAAARRILAAFKESESTGRTSLEVIKREALASFADGLPVYEFAVVYAWTFPG